MHALFVSLSTNLPTLKSPHVYLFDTQEEAEHFAVNALSEAGMAAITVLDSGRYQRPLSSEELTAEQVLEEFQDGLGSSEYLHVVPTTSLSRP